MRQQAMTRTTLALMLTLTWATQANSDVPVGFQVLGTVVPKSAESTPIPAGWIEKQPPNLNTDLPLLTARERQRGYVTFHKHYLEMVYPGTRPTREEMTDSVSLFSARGEYEITTFSIHALTNLTDVRVESSELRSTQHTLSAENIQVRSVRCMPNRLWAEAAYVVRPTLLELRDQLKVSAEATQRYWITVWVPPGTPAGEYRGTITIRTRMCAPRTLSLHLEVLPIDLPPTPIRQGMYGNFVVLNDDLRNLPSLPKEQLRKQLLDLREHGMNTLFISFGPTLRSIKSGETIRFDLSPLDTFAELCGEAGITQVIYNVWTDEFIDNEHGTFPTLVKAFVDSWRQRRWPELILSAGDEADANGSLQRVLRAFRAIKKVLPDIKIYTTVVFPEKSEVFEPLVDIRAFSSYADETIVERTRRAGRQLWMYSGTSEYGAGGRGDRLYRGLWSEKLTLVGARDWTYWRPSLDYSPPFNDLIDNGSSRPNFSGWIFPTDNGPLPTTGWEAIREGVEDGRYIHALQQLIKERRKKIGDDDSLSKEAEAFLKATLDRVDTSPRPRKPDGSADNTKFPLRIAAEKIDPDFFDQVRREIAERIITFQSATDQ